MPPKIKITKENIIDAAFEIARKEGADKITARNLAQQMKCSTQPVLYQFASVDEIRREVYQKVDDYHSEYIMKIEDGEGNPLLSIGMNYIRFAMEESNLFQFLFHSNEFSDATILELIDSEDVLPILSVLQQEIDISLPMAKEIFSTLFIFIHGYASLYANNKMVYDETLIKSMLTKVFYGAIYVAKGDKNEEDI